MHSSQATVEPVCAKVPSRKAKKHMDSQSKKNTEKAQDNRPNNSCHYRIYKPTMHLSTVKKKFSTRNTRGIEMAASHRV